MKLEGMFEHWKNLAREANVPGVAIGVLDGANGDKLWKPILEDLTGEIHPALAWLEEG